MASRLYCSTQGLYRHIERCLYQLQLQLIGSPTLVALIALYVTGLVLLDGRQTQTRVTRYLPGRCHDALNRLLRLMPLSTRALMKLLAALVRRLGQDGYLCLDDVVVEKAFAKRLRWAGWVYYTAKAGTVYGIHIVVLSWCSLDGHWRIPVGFRLRRPKQQCRPDTYRTRVQLGQALVIEAIAAGLPIQYVVFDKMYTSGWFTKWLTNLDLTWHGMLEAKTKVVWHGHRHSVGQLAPRLRLKWRAQLGLRAVAHTVYAPSYGHLRLVVTRNRHGNWQYLVSNDLGADLTTMVRRKRSRWSIETIFRDTKQFAGLGACQCWVDQAMVRHVALVLLTFVVLQISRTSPDESVGAVKERWQLATVRNGETAPEPLRACPAELRVTA